MQKIYHDGKYYTREEMKKIVTDYYNHVFTNKSDRHMQMLSLLPDDLNKNSYVLDYGCGMGGISNLFASKYNCHVDAVDISRNELEKAIITFSGGEHKIDFIMLDDFGFPSNKYDLVFSSQVIEHVHNPGIYLSNINKMIKENGYLLIGLPNIVNVNYAINLMFFSQKRARKHSKKMLENYNKAMHHINGWDPLHFITLCASVGFELLEWIPTEGTPISSILYRIPIVGKYLYHLPITTRLSYTMFFLFRKKFDKKIEIYE